MFRPSSLPLRARLIVLVFASTLPLVAFGLLGAYLNYRAERENVGQRTLDIARSMAKAVDAEHRIHIATLQALALSPALQAGDVTAFRPVAQAFLDAQPKGSTLGIADPSGQLLLAVSGDVIPSGPLPRRRNIDMIERVFRTGEAAISNLFVNALDQRRTYTVEVPVLSNGRVVYEMGLDPTFATLNEIISRQRLAGDWIVSIFDAQGVTVARQPNPGRFVGQRTSPSLYALLTTRAEGLEETVSLEGTPLYTAFSHSESSGWSVAIGIPRARLVEPLWHSVLVTLGVGGLFLLASLILAAATAQGIEGPIASLARFASATDHGMPGPRWRTGLREVDEVGHVLATSSVTLREREARLRAVLDAAPIGLVFGEAPTGRITGGNAQVERMLGHPTLASADVQAYGAWAGFHLDGRPVEGHEYPLARAIRGEEERPELEVLYRRGDGRETWVRFVAAPIRNDAGQITGGVVASLDIDRERRAELALRDLNASLEQRVVTAVADRENAEAQLRQAQKMEAVGRLTGGIAHDFNNLLTIIMGNLDLLGRRMRGATVDPRASRAVDNAADGARRAAILTQRLLAFSRQSPLSPEVLDVNALVAGMSDMLRRTLGEQVAVETVLAGGLWRCEVDRNQLESALLNLAVNARDAMPSGGRLTIETANAHLDEDYASRTTGEVKPGQFVLISVSDSGIGMSPDVQARAFEPFFTTKPVGKGTGLGLSQVYGFLRQSGGHAAVYSEPEQGTTVKLYFPRVRREQDVPRPTEEAKTAEPTGPGGRGELILVIEDEPLVREFSVSVLEQEGYSVLSAEDGVTGLSLLDAHLDRIELLFTDVVLTGPLNGRQVAEEALRRRPNLKVLFTTSYTRNAIVHHGRLDDDAELIGKPFTASSLASKVRVILDETRGRGPA